MSVLAQLVNVAWSTANAPASRAFAAALARPRETQLGLLHGYLASAAGTRFGADHGLDRRWTSRGPMSLDEFRSRVPVRGYDDFRPWFDRIADGEPAVLSRAGIDRWIPSSGSTSAAKLIPSNATLRAEFRRGLAPWINDLFMSMPDLRGGSAYWSISPVARHTSQPLAGIPVGVDDDAAYLGGLARRLAACVMAVPGDVRWIGDMQVWRHVTLLLLLRDCGLRLISVWHPSFLELLLSAMEEGWESLLRDIARGAVSSSVPLGDGLRVRLAARLRRSEGRARELEKCGPGDVRAIWPRLGLVSCWADAHAALHARRLAERLQCVAIQPKGIIATEAMVSIPYGPWHPLAVRSHFFEFLDDRGDAHEAHELEAGRSYTLVVTTGGGLWRYLLHDRVVVEGFVQRTPSLRFAGKEDHLCDLRGEKLSEGFVASVFAALWAHHRIEPRFALLAPNERSNGYTLFIEADELPADLAGALDEGLRGNPHYAYARDLGQLAPPGVAHVARGATRTYLEVVLGRGRRLGDIKAAALDAGANWSRRFEDSARERQDASPPSARRG